MLRALAGAHFASLAIIFIVNLIVHYFWLLFWLFIIFVINLNIYYFCYYFDYLLLFCNYFDCLLFLLLFWWLSIFVCCYFDCLLSLLLFWRVIIIIIFLLFWLFINFVFIPIHYTGKNCWNRTKKKKHNNACDISQIA